MALDRLGPASAIFAALRAEVSKRADRTSPGAPQSDASPGQAATHKDVAALRRQLVDIAHSVKLDDLQAVESARTRIVRAILLWEFGSGLREHPDWQPMLDSIAQALQASPDHEAQFLALLGDLKRSPQTP